MKKVILTALLLSFVGLFLAHATIQNRPEKTVVVKQSKIQQIEKKIVEFSENFGNYVKGNLHTAIILMVIGLIFLILASAIGGSIVWAAGAVFFIIGALLLLLYLL